MPPPQLAADLLAMMVRGVSVIVGSRDADHRPSLMRAVGSDVAPDGASVTVYLARSQARQLLQDIASTGHIAAVFSELVSHRTVQLKATRATLRPATEGDAPVLARYQATMENEITRIGHPASIARTMLAHRLDDVVAVSFSPEQAYNQTPGPQAGSRVGARR